MLQRHRIDQPDHAQHARACQRGHGHADEGDEELVEMLGEQPSAQPLPQTGADERADHVIDAAAQQEDERRAGQTGSQSRLPRRVQRSATFDQVQPIMDLAHG